MLAACHWLSSEVNLAVTHRGPRAFAPDVVTALRAAGWTIVELPAGLTLGGLRRSGAPFRGDRFFREFSAAVADVPTEATEIAYRPWLVPESLNRSYAECEELITAFGHAVPPGCRAIIGQAAAYVQILWRHGQETGQYPIGGTFTWTSDLCRDGHLVVGIFGRERPIVIGPHPTSGRGIGVLPLLIPC